MRRFSTLLSLALVASACTEAPEDDVDDTDTDVDTDTDAIVGDTDTDSDTDTDGGGGPDDDPNDVVVPDPADFDYSARVVFSLDHVQGGADGTTAKDDPTILCTTGCEDQVHPTGAVGMIPIDSDFGWTVADFHGVTAVPRDGVYAEGWVGPLQGEDGSPWGIRVSTEPTKTYAVGYPKGAWCAGLGGDLVKCSSEHYVTMENALTCYETIPYLLFDPGTHEPVDPLWAACELLLDDLDVDPAGLPPYEEDLLSMAVGTDYAVTQKDDGKALYRWGTWEKRPTEVRVAATIPVPDAWKADGAPRYEITRAQLAVVHTISNSPNDQIRPEDLENEAAKGRIPAYDVQSDGSWTSARDCYQSDGSFLPQGTVFKHPDHTTPGAISGDLRSGFTAAWYTTLDRDPFEADATHGVGPRWRFKAPKFGQDIPEMEIPVDNCAQQPIQRSDVKYEVGTRTATVIDLLDWVDGEDSPLRYSDGWMAPTIQEMDPLDDTLTQIGMRLTEDLDLSLYVKGEKKTVDLHWAILYVDYVEAD